MIPMRLGTMAFFLVWQEKTLIAVIGVIFIVWGGMMLREIGELHCRTRSKHLTKAEALEYWEDYWAFRRPGLDHRSISYIGGYLVGLRGHARQQSGYTNDWYMGWDDAKGDWGD